jgi:hypothetical protein
MCSRQAQARGLCKAHATQRRSGRTLAPLTLSSKQYPPLADVFWSLVKKGDGDACWEWQGKRQWQGYGFYGSRRKHGAKTAVHRFSWEQASGKEIPPGMFVCHKCDNPPCVRPDHLFLGTPKDNMVDCERKGRRPHALGSACHLSKLDEERVLLIRLLAASGCRTKDLAALFEVDPMTISRIKTRRIWRHVEIVEAT